MEKLVVFGIILGFFGVVIAVIHTNYRREMRDRATRAPTFDDQLDTVIRAGIRLTPGVSRDDILHSFTAAQYEANPYALLLFILGQEVERAPWGRKFSPDALTVDMEGITGPGSYAALVNGLARMAGVAEGVTRVSDEIDRAAGRASLRYTVGGRAVVLTPTWQDDWIDPATLATILGDIAPLIPAGRGLWSRDNGQQRNWFCLSDAGAERINRARPGVLTRM